MADKGLGYLTQRVTFSALHSLESPDLTEDENRRLFGKCFRTHGHDYHLEVTVRGKISGVGFCCNRDDLEDVLKKEIVARFHGTHLNKSFKSTTGEELVREFYQILVEKLPYYDLVMVRLQETAKNFFVYGKKDIAPSDFRFLMY